MSILNFLKNWIVDFGDDRIVDPADSPENNLTEPYQYPNTKLFIDVNALKWESMASTIEMNNTLKRSIPQLKNEISEIRKDLTNFGGENSQSNEIEYLKAEIAEMKKRMASMK